MLSLGCAAGGGEEGKTVLVFKHGKLAGAPGAMREILAGFEGRHPGVVVREELLPASTDQQHQYFAINLESRTPPFDLMAVDIIWAQEFARAAWVRALDDVVGPPERQAHFPAAIEAATFEGRLYAVPWYVDAGVLFYRKDLLERYGLPMPTTWPELTEAVRTIVQGERDPALHGFVWPGRQSEGLVCVAFEFIWGHGGTFLEPDIAGPATGFMRALLEEGISPAGVATADEETTRLLFGDGRAVFMRNWPYAWRFLQQSGSPVRGKVGVGPIPAFPGHEAASVLGGWMLAVPRRAAHADLATELAVYLSSRDVQQRMARAMSYSPSRPALYTQPEASDGRQAMPALLTVFERARPRPVTPYYLMVSHALQPEFSAIVVGRKTPAAALDDARRRISKITDESQ